SCAQPGRFAGSGLLSDRVAAFGPWPLERRGAELGARTGRVRRDADVRWQPDRPHPDAAFGLLHRDGIGSSRRAVAVDRSRLGRLRLALGDARWSFAADDSPAWGTAARRRPTGGESLNVSVSTRGTGRGARDRY